MIWKALKKVLASEIISLKLEIPKKKPPREFVRTKYYAAGTGATCTHGYLKCYYTWATPVQHTCTCCGVYDPKVNETGMCVECRSES